MLFVISDFFDRLSDVNGKVADFLAFGKHVIVEDAGGVIVFFLFNGNQVFLFQDSPVIVDGFSIS